MKSEADSGKNEKMIFDELIVVEGKNDAHALRRALGKVDVIWTEGFGLTEDKVRVISEMAKRRGVIVCTDPDFAGSQIRERICKRVPDVRHVYLTLDAAREKKSGDIGLENVSPEEIRKAFSIILEEREPLTAERGRKDNENIIGMEDMLANSLAGEKDSAARRARLGNIFGIGNTNAKQFLFRVNRYGITREAFYQAVKTIEGMEG